MTQVSEAAAQHAAEELRYMADKISVISGEISAKKACAIQHIGALRGYQETLELCIDILDKARHLAELGL